MEDLLLEGVPVEKEEGGEVIIPERVGGSHVWLFPGFTDTENRWLKAIRKLYDQDSEPEGDKSDSAAVVVAGEDEGREEREGRETVAVEEREKREGDIQVEILSKRAKFE